MGLVASVTMKKRGTPTHIAGARLGEHPVSFAI